MALRSPSCLVVVVVVVVQVLLEPVALAVCGDAGGPTSCGSDTCRYQPDCTCCGVNNLVPDPEDCQQFYVCTGTGPDDYNTLPASCPEDQVFDPDNQACVDPGSYTCPTCSEEQVCVYECVTGYSGFFSSHDDCNEYYACVDGDTFGPVHCDAATPFFDGHTCQTEETLCCSCQPFCAPGQGAVIDPLDCRKYWLCSSTTLYPGECPEGKVFDITLGDCSAKSTCVTTCPNVVNITGCIDPFICLSTGFFAMCPNLCVQEYYHCEALSEEYQEPESCATGTVFHPDTHTCVNPSYCPYPVPESLRLAH